MVRCPECDAEIDLDEDEMEEGELLSCPECEKALEVVQVHPLRLDVLSEDDLLDEEEDEESESDDDEDEEDEDEEEPEEGEAEYR